MTKERQTWMGLLARAPEDRLKALWAETGMTPAFSWLRAPEVGGVMLRGRTGGTGAAFNLGEMTVTRCALRLTDCGSVGHAYVQGRDKSKAEIAALADAILQSANAAVLQDKLLTPLQAEEVSRRTSRAGKAAATKVDFFTLVRGEDA